MSFLEEISKFYMEAQKRRLNIKNLHAHFKKMLKKGKEKCSLHSEKPWQSALKNGDK